MPKILGWSEENISASSLRDRQYQPSTGFDVPDRTAISSTSLAAGSNGVLRLTFFTPTRSMTISNFSIVCNTGSADSGGTTVRKLGLFAISGTSATCVARSANDKDLATVSSTIYTKAFTSEAGYSSTYTITAGTTYAVGWLFYNTGGTFGTPNLAVLNPNTATATFQTPYVTGLVGTATDITNTPVTFSASGFGPYMRLT